MSEGQIAEIQKIMHKNNRPVQKMHDRVLKISK
jgi:carbonic anhydrase